MPSENSFISIRFADEFEENLYRLSKRFRNVRKDIINVIEQIQAGNFVGD
jgi:mRNA-degrading endonuclease RelE of RelBE toxin-antitoxin system